MKQTLYFFILALLFNSCYVTKSSVSDTLKTNAQVTADFYQSLIESDDVNEVMLNLFFTNMPKGGDLHHHYTGTIYAETYLDWVKEKEWKIDSCTLRIVEPEDTNKHCRLYTVDELMKDNIRYSVLLSLWSDKDYHHHNHNQPTPDINFFNTFSYFSPISDKNRSQGLKILKERALKENVSYIETMLTRIGIDNSDYYTKDEITILDESLRKASSQAETDTILDKIAAKFLANQNFTGQVNDFVKEVSLIHQGIDDDNFTMRFQTYCVRVLPPVQVYTDLLSGFLAANQSDLIVGVNIVAPENNQTSLDDYTLHMRMFNHLMRKYPTVKRALHAGELTLGMVRPKDLQFHIHEAIDIAQANRIGHGVDISYEENSIELLAKIKEKSAVEINLTSNEFILGVKDQMHPYLIYSKYGVPIVISTDDSGVSRNNLTNEYVLLSARYKPSYSTIKKYVYNSMHYSFLNDADKKELKNRLDSNFTAFEQQMAGLQGKLNN